MQLVLLLALSLAGVHLSPAVVLLQLRLRKGLHQVQEALWRI